MSSETTGATVAYYRTSTGGQTLDSQRHAVAAAGVTPDREFTDHGVSGRKARRPGLDAMLDYVREGDTLVCYSLSRLGRSTVDVLDLLHRLTAKGVTVRSITESLDSASPGGRLVVVVLAAVAEMEADLTRERTMAGLAAARARGRVGGAPRVAVEKVRVLQDLVGEGVGVSEAARQAGLSRATAYRYLNAGGE